MQDFDNTVKGYLSFLDNQYVKTGLALFLILYASLAAPRLPEYIAKLFDNMFFKLLIFFLIAYVAQSSPTVAIIAAIAVMVSLMTLSRYKFNAEMMNVVNRYEGFSENSEDNCKTYRTEDHDVIMQAKNLMGEGKRFYEEGQQLLANGKVNEGNEIMAEGKNLIIEGKKLIDNIRMRNNDYQESQPELMLLPEQEVPYISEQELHTELVDENANHLIEEGQQMMDEGQRLMEEGNNLVNEGNIEEGEKLVEEGAYMVEEGKMIRENCELNGEQLRNKGVYLMEEGKRLAENGRAQEGKLMIEEGKKILSSGGNLILKGQELLGMAQEDIKLMIEKGKQMLYQGKIRREQGRVPEGNQLIDAGSKLINEAKLFIQGKRATEQTPEAIEESMPQTGGQPEMESEYSYVGNVYNDGGSDVITEDIRNQIKNNRAGKVVAAVKKIQAETGRKLGNEEIRNLCSRVGDEFGFEKINLQELYAEERPFKILPTDAFPGGVTGLNDNQYASV